MRTVVTVARNENIYFFRWESIANWVLMLSQYFGSSFKTRSAPIMIRLLLEPIYEQGACFLKRSASFWNESFSSKRLFELDLFTFEITSNNKIELCQSPKTGKTMKTREIFWKSKNQKKCCSRERYYEGTCKINFRKLVQLEIPKNRGNCGRYVKRLTKINYP